MKNSNILTVVFIILITNFLLNGVYGIFFTIPILIGTFLLLNLVKIFLKNSTIFHPIPFVSMVMLWSLVCAPFIASGTGYNLALPPKEIDWLFWHVTTSLMYTTCIVFFYVGVLFGSSYNIIPKSRVTKSSIKLKSITTIFLLVSLITQLLVFAKFGGLIGYMNAWSESREQFQGLGTLLMLAEPFPIILAFYVLLNLRENKKTLLFFAVILLIFFILKLIFGGFRGSRSNTIWGLFWIAGAIHIAYYRFKKIHFTIGLIFLISFMSIYSLYKSFGVDVFSGNYALEDTNRYNNSSAIGTLLTDFSRTGEHAFILHEYYNNDNYHLKFGQTYISSLSKLIPGLNNSLGMVDKNFAGAELFYGKHIDPKISYYYNSRVYGLYGEGLFNFGPFIPVIFFSFVGCIIGIFHKYSINLHINDPRVLLVPFISNLSLLLILADSDNIIFYTFKNGLLVFIYIYFISKPKMYN